MSASSLASPRIIPREGGEAAASRSELGPGADVASCCATYWGRCGEVPPEADAAVSHSQPTRRVMARTSRLVRRVRGWNNGRASVKHGCWPTAPAPMHARCYERVTFHASLGRARARVCSICARGCGYSATARAGGCWKERVRLRSCKTRPLCDHSRQTS